LHKTIKYQWLVLLIPLPVFAKMLIKNDKTASYPNLIKVCCSGNSILSISGIFLSKKRVLMVKNDISATWTKTLHLIAILSVILNNHINTICQV